MRKRLFMLALIVAASVAPIAGDWGPCRASSTACCNPHTSPSQYCPGNVKCQECGGGDACECPSGPSPTPSPTPPPTNCTPSGQDPYQTDSLVSCCAGSTQVLEGSQYTCQPTGLYKCSSADDLGAATARNQKGLALDDDTFKACVDRIPYVWPHTQFSVKSIRLFKSWNSTWGSDQTREAAWADLVKFVHANDAKVLIGTQISCNEAEDDADWNLAKQLMAKLGADHIMGVAIGNEMDMIWVQTSDPQCIHNMWQGGYFLRKTNDRISDLDRVGLGSVKVTSVFGGYSLNGNPFVEQPNAMVNSFLTEMHQKYGRRWAFTFNFYPYFDASNQLDPGTTNQCAGAVARSTCFTSGCLMNDILATARTRMQSLTGNVDDTLWLGEVGWSSPVASTLVGCNHDMAQCSEFSSIQSFKKLYKNFLSWDLSINSNLHGVDHVFYFTVRDSPTFHKEEHFGLIASCGDSQCKQLSGEMATMLV